jgi:hypothetical protein
MEIISYARKGGYNVLMSLVYELTLTMIKDEMIYYKVKEFSTGNKLPKSTRCQGYYSK